MSLHVLQHNPDRQAQPAQPEPLPCPDAVTPATQRRLKVVAWAMAALLSLAAWAAVGRLLGAW